MDNMTRRDMMKTGLAAAALGATANFEWVLPALAQGEVMVPFTDSHVNPPFNANPAPDRRLFDTRTLSSTFTPKDQFFTTQHYGHPEVDPVAYRLKVGWPRQHGADALARRHQEDGQRGARQRLRMLGQPPPGAGTDRQRPLDRRAAEDVLDKAGLKSNAARSCSSAPIAARKPSTSAAPTSTSSSSTAAASSATRRFRPIARRSSRMR
jgi:hypothetical protein